jgi:hypothetical protein
MIMNAMVAVVFVVVTLQTASVGMFVRMGMLVPMAVGSLAMRMRVIVLVLMFVGAVHGTSSA